MHDTNHVAVLDFGSQYTQLIVRRVRELGYFAKLYAIEDFPEALVKRVEQGGRVVTGIVKNDVTRLAVGRRVGARISLLTLAEVGIARLAQFDKAKEWSF